MLQAPWYTYPLINNYGVYPDPEGKFPKPDINVVVPSGIPITAIGSGVVSGINSPFGNIPSYGQVVTIKLDQPINNIATHEAYLHLSSVQTGLHKGQRINVGDVIGYSGNNPSGASTGFALYNDDFYGYGGTWNKYVGTDALNPTQVLSAFINGGSNGQLTALVTSNTLQGSNLLSDSTNPLNNVLGGFDFTRFIDATILFILALTFIIVGFVLLMSKTIENNSGTIAKIAGTIA